jgi:Arc/MetJ family transcription regulator
VDIDDEVLAAARAQLGAAATIKETVNEALRRMAGVRRASVDESLEILSHGSPHDRSTAWR